MKILKKPIIFSLLFCFVFSCKKSENKPKLFGYAVLEHAVGICAVSIRFHKGKENMYKIYPSLASDSAWNRYPLVGSTQKDALSNAYYFGNGYLETGDSVYVEFREDVEDLGYCGGQGVPYPSLNVYFTSVKKLE